MTVLGHDGDNIVINQNGIRDGGTVIKNVGNGRIEENSKDAVMVGKFMIY